MIRSIPVNTTVNGQPAEFLCRPQESLLTCLRQQLSLTGSKNGCGDGNCGACSVILNGKLVNSCLVLGVEAEGAEITTVEGLARGGQLDALQEAFIEEDGFQCGFCTPGFQVSAAALLERNPDPSEAEIRHWISGNLCRCTGYETIVRAVRSAARKRRGEGAPRSNGKPAASGSVIGTNPPRVDGFAKVTGRARFGADAPSGGAAVGRLLRSPHAHARIRSIDTSGAEALPGVLAVVTANDLYNREEAMEDDFRYQVERALASQKVLFQGHVVAAVAAVSEEAATAALRRIGVDYEVLPAVTSIAAALAPDAPLLHEQLKTRSLAGTDDTPSNVALHLRHLLGDPSAGFAEADVVIERRFDVAMAHHSYIEPQSSTARWEDGMLEVTTTTQGAFAIRSQISELLRLPLARIVVKPTEIGGGFGGKNEVICEIPAALLARKCGRPVQVTLTRHEVLTGTGTSPGTAVRVKMGAKQDGTLTAAAAELHYEAGAFPGAMIGAGARNLFAPYVIPNAQVDAYDVVVNKPYSASYRAPCLPQAAFAGEQVIDELAQRLDLDPIEFRLRNGAENGSRIIDSSVHEHIGGREVLEAARDHPHNRSPLEGPHRGRGVAHAFWGNWGGQSSCQLTVHTDGTVSLISGSVDVTGTRTSIAMQAAEALELPLDQVRPGVADTAGIGYADVSAGSRTTVATGKAAIEAAHAVIAEMKRRAARLWEAEPEAIAYDGGTFRQTDGEQAISFAELAAKTPATGGVVTGVANINMTQWGGAFATHIVDVEVDPETGRVQLLRYTAVQDVGRAIHPIAVEGQIRGGTTQGIGLALYEGYRYSESGQLLNGSFLDYQLPTALDVPAIDPVIVEVPFPGHPYGARGVGEVPIVPPAAAIANAIARATGSRVSVLPMTPRAILEAQAVLEPA